MKFSLNWLKELTPFTWSADELAERLTMAGIEVEGVEIQGRGFDRVMVARILSSEKHPNADRLSVCEVEDGSGKRQIVCGAKNYQAGDLVPLAVPGAKLPGGMEIRRSKIRGVESDGMMCSPKELGLADDAQGLMILPADLKIGLPLAQALGLNDTLFDLEITPNRPDLLSHWGLSREITALADLPQPDQGRLLSEADEPCLAESPDPSSGIPVRVEDFTACPRYTARIIRGVKIAPSPDWMRRRLENLGQRAISNVVDITNYVLQEIGQPLHAFDLKLLEGPEIIIRQARAGEKIARLDDETSELRPGMLVIADARRPVALAGVIGGRETGVSDATADILLESAAFQPSSIRKTSKTLGVSTDSSYRFERGVDPELAAWASRRATRLILEICGGRAEGTLMDVRSAVLPRPEIRCRHSRVQSVLGVPIEPGKMISLLKRLQCSVVENERDSCQVAPPSWRPDLEREIDLIEEIARLNGVERIPAALAPAPLSTTRDSVPFLFARRLRALAAALGLDEAFHYPLVASAQNLADDALQLANPLTSEMNSLRPSLFTGLLETAARNLAGGNPGVAMFELGKVFYVEDSKVQERLSLGILLAGVREDGAPWEHGVAGCPYDFYDLKGIVDALFENLGVEHLRSPSTAEVLPTTLKPGAGFLLRHGEGVAGYAGKVADRETQRAKIPADAFYAELDCAWLMSVEKTERRYQRWPVYPAVRRDIALTVSQEKKHQAIEESLRRLAKKHAESRGFFLQQARLFDIFQSEKIGADRKSLAYSMIYRSSEKTLTDAEVNEIHDAIKKDLTCEIPCEIRD
ncbi:MAG: phenylalanine--tRNA ligase subunit beta [Verrucomicrobia bacterium]|nr:phenylalanine--tRNA ligase subunit beta [Verrucomicrobiota bacterium]